MNRPFRLSRPFLALALAVGVFAAVAGSKALLVFRYASDIPYWDELPKQGEMIDARYYEGTLRLADFLIPHNEHRIAPTLALNLGLVLAGGQWDSSLESTINAMLFGAIAAGLALWAWRALGPAWGVAMAWGWAVIGALPIDWENALRGFQSQFYFLMGFSLLAIGGLLVEAGPRSRWWWLGLAAAVLAGVSMGSGFLCLAPVAAISAWRLVRGWSASSPTRLNDPVVGLTRRGRRVPPLVTLLVAIVLLIVGWITRAPAPWHKDFHAHNAHDFLLYCAHSLAWPFPDWAWLCLIFWTPWAVLAYRCFLGREEGLYERSRFILAGGLWLLAQVAAVAYARGNGGGTPASRYGDILACGVIFNLMAFSGWPRGRLRPAAFAAWAVAIAAAGCAGSWNLWRADLATTRDQLRQAEGHTHSYIVTGDPAYLAVGEQAFPWPEWERRTLDRPSLRPLYPVSIRAPLPMAEASAPDGFRRRNLPAGTVVTLDRDVWDDAGAAGPAEWRSRPISPTHFSYWEIEMTGRPAKPGAWLRLETADGRVVSPPIAPSRRPGRTWRSAYVRLPRGSGPLVLHAYDPTPAEPFGFRAPVEYSALSNWARRIGRQAVWIWAAGAALLLAVSCRLAAASRPPRSGGSSPPATG